MLNSFSLPTQPSKDKICDHDLVIAEIKTRPIIIVKQVPHNTPLYKKAFWDHLKQSMTDLHKDLQSDLATTEINVL